jgi:hypothetical protein
VLGQLSSLATLYESETIIRVGSRDVMPQMGNPVGDIEGDIEKKGESKGGHQKVPLDSQRKLCKKALEKLQFPPARHGLRPAVHVELAIDVLQVLFDCARGDDQPASDLLVREALGKQS